MCRTLRRCAFIERHIECSIDELENEGSSSDNAGTSGQEIPSNDVLEN